MTQKFRIMHERLKSSIDHFYSKNDYYIEYSLELSDEQIQYKNKYEKRLIQYKTLTIIFCAITHRFISFDAYTNIDLWNICTNLKIPECSDSGSLEFISGFEADDRYSVPFYPKYEYYLPGTLKIILGNDDKSKFYKIAEDLIVGIEDLDIITSFYLTNLVVN